MFGFLWRSLKRDSETQATLDELRDTVEASHRVDDAIGTATLGCTEEQRGVYLEQLYRRAFSDTPFPAVCRDCKFEWLPGGMPKNCPCCGSPDWWDYTDDETRRLFCDALERCANQHKPPEVVEGLAND